MLIVADDKIPFLRGVLEPFSDVVYLAGKDIDFAAVKDADAIITRTRTRCNEQLLKESKVKFIGTATIGYDHIDTSWCANNGIYWTNAPGCNSSSVRQYIASALLHLADVEQFELEEKTLGIIGVGNVGSKVEQFAKSLGMTVLLNDPPLSRIDGGDKFVPLDYLLKNSDIITVHVPLNKSGEDSTLHLFDEHTFAKMKHGSWFINSSRGEVVATDALKSSLATGGIKGAILDVWEHEPDIDLELMHNTVLSTPHIAGYSTDGKANGTSMIVNALASFFNIPVSKWYPDNLPLPRNSIIEVDCSEKSVQQIVTEVVTSVYDVVIDSDNLRTNPSLFESLRGNYPMRREFTAYTVKLINGTKETKELLRNIGFSC